MRSARAIKKKAAGRTAAFEFVFLRTLMLRFFPPADRNCPERTYLVAQPAFVLLMQANNLSVGANSRLGKAAPPLPGSRGSSWPQADIGLPEEGGLNYFTGRLSPSVLQRRGFFVRSAYFLVLRIADANSEVIGPGMLSPLLEERNAWPVNHFEPPLPLCAPAAANRSRWLHKV
jgi:hypothetical protein